MKALLNLWGISFKTAIQYPRITDGTSPKPEAGGGHFET